MRAFVVFIILLSFVIPVVASDMLPMAPTRYDDKDELPYGDFTSISGVDPKIPDQDPKKPVVKKSVADKKAPAKQTRAPAKTVQKSVVKKNTKSAVTKKRAPSAQKKKLPQKLPPKKAK